MTRRKLLSPEERQAILGIPDEASLIRHYTLSPQDRLQAEVRRRAHNQLGYAVKLCLMRHPGRILGVEESPPAAMVSLCGRAAGGRPRCLCPLFASLPHTFRSQPPSGAIPRPSDSDTRGPTRGSGGGDQCSHGDRPRTAVINTFRERGAHLLPDGALEKIGIAGRAIARQRAEAALLGGLTPDQLDSP
jgi:hypothetical protein